ncbi:MAG: serine hydrolase, partial [Bacteroidota bacterium]
AVLVAEGDRVLYEGGFGFADHAWEIPNTPDTRFRVASTTKQFTSALVHRLAEDGLIDLDAPISTYLPDYPEPQGSLITAQQLLNQTAGIPNYTSLPEWESIMRDPVDPLAFLDTFAGLPLQFEPGSQFGYSNSNYFVLGVLIEAVTDQTYAEALHERILAPLGLDDTAADVPGRVVARKARGYVRISGGYAQERYIDMSLPYAAGMLYSSVRDLHRWKRALHSAAPFQSAETLRRMLTPSGEGPYGYAHGLGVNQRVFGPDTVITIGHGGHIEGFNSDDVYLPEREWTVIVLDNTNGDVGRVGQDLIRLLLGHEVEPPRRSVAEAMADLIATDGLDAAVAEYRAIRDRSDPAYDLGEAQLQSLGHAYSQGGYPDIAVQILRLNAESYPESADVHGALGDAYAEAGDQASAIRSYQRALDLDAENARIREALSQLQAE